jgi:hypothetical protein
MSAEPGTSVVSRPSILRSLKMVAWSFIGIRSRAGLEDDVARVNPLHILLAGVLAAFVFVVSLIALATWVVGK